MILLEHHVGRLLESRFSSPLDAAQLAAFQDQREALRDRLGRDRVVVMDFRKASVLPPELADTLLAMLSGENPGLLRNGLLLPSTGAVAALQLQRIVRDAKSDRRRTFRDAGELERWLGEILDAAERARLREFMSA